ncbi:hypothetical protein HDV00_009060 [Rhizophlyctis rosea]|nr:hypothetical protein HDV00_009060 [Rhizophlyctis rosea]
MKLTSLFMAVHAVALAAATPFGGRALLYDLASDNSMSVARSGRSQQGTVMDRLRKEEDFRRFVKALENEAGLRDDLDRRDAKVTVFAPTNQAMERLEDEIEKLGREGERPSMEQILSYHIVRDEELCFKDLKPGMTLRTNLRPNDLDRHHQRIRVVGMMGGITLNMRAQIVDRDIKAENGMIHGINGVLMPPRDLYRQTYRIPTELSTWHMALVRTDMQRELERGKAWTVFTPSNEAWQRMGYRNLEYLFGCEQGRKELKKIVEYHMSEEFAYTTKMMKERECRMPTRHGDKLTISTCSRRGDCKHEHGRMDEENPGKYAFVMNHGMARVEFPDIPSENGVMHMINEVLIPEDVKLPQEGRM